MTPGEPITYVTDVDMGPRRTGPRQFRKGLAHSEVDEVLSYEVFLVAKNGSPFLGPDEEGVRWIRGRHSEKSEAGQALLAAYALSRSIVA